MQYTLKTCALKTQLAMYTCEWQMVSKINSQVIHKSYPDLWRSHVRNLCKSRGKPVDARWITWENSGIIHTPAQLSTNDAHLPVHKKWAATCEKNDLHRIHSPYYYYYLLPLEIPDRSRFAARLGKRSQDWPVSGIPWMRATANIRQEESA